MAGKALSKDQKREKQARGLLRGAVDFHIHSAPDVFPRLLSDIEIARQAKRAGMAAVLIKSHVTMTADRAKIAPGGQSVSRLPGNYLNRAGWEPEAHGVERPPRWVPARYGWPTLNALRTRFGIGRN